MQERFTVAGMIRAHAGERPQAEMLVCGSERRSWSDQFARSCATAQALSDEGVGEGGRVAFLDRNDLAYFDLLFGGALILLGVTAVVTHRPTAPNAPAATPGTA